MFILNDNSASSLSWHSLLKFLLLLKGPQNAG